MLASPTVLAFPTEETWTAAILYLDLEVVWPSNHTRNVFSYALPSRTNSRLPRWDLSLLVWCTGEREESIYGLEAR